MQILWQSGNISDNIGIASVVFSPPNGSIFESAKTHKVEMTATDTSGNQAKCVMEVKITGKYHFIISVLDEIIKYHHPEVKNKRKIVWS